MYKEDQPSQEGDIQGVTSMDSPRQSNAVSFDSMCTQVLVRVLSPGPHVVADEHRVQADQDNQRYSVEN